MFLSPYQHYVVNALNEFGGPVVLIPDHKYGQEELQELITNGVIKRTDHLNEYILVKEK